MSLSVLSTGPLVIYNNNTVIDSPPGGNGDGRFDPGESGQIVVALRNVGNEAAEDVTAKLRSGYSLFVITDSSSAYGDIPAGSTRTNNADRFAASADASIPIGTIVPCTLLVHSSNWVHDWTYVFGIQVGLPPVPPQYVITLDTGEVSLSVCAIGSIGYDEPPTDLGTGFQVPKGVASCLFYGGLMAGNSESYLADHHFSRPANSGTNHDWQMLDSFRFVMPPTPADEQWVNTMSDGGHPSSKGLGVEQRWYMNTENEYDDWAIVVFDFENNGSSAINGLHVGMIGDFDVGSSPTANIAGSDTVRRGVWMRQASSENPTAGFVLLAPTSFANLTAVDHARYVYPDSCMTDGQKFRLLDGTIAQRQSNRNYDWSVVASAGPFNLEVGMMQRVAFAVVGATSQECWTEAAGKAQEWYDANILGVEENPGRIATGQGVRTFLMPNPFRNGTFVHYFSRIPGPVELTAFDASGREVERTVFQTEKGEGRYFWQPKSLARGVYFLKVRTQDQESVAKVLLVE